MRRAALATSAVLLCLLGLLAWLALGRDAPVRDAPPAPEAPLEVTPPASAPHAARERRHEGPEVPHAPDVTPAPAEPAWDGPVATGIVVDAQGAPVSGARIVSHPDEVSGTLAGGDVGREGSRTFVAESGDDGTFTLPIDADSVSLVLTATADQGMGQVALPRGARGATIRLEPWRVLLGSVTDIAKKPIAGAQVRVCLMLDALVEERTAVSGDDGAYRIDRIPPLGYGENRRWVGAGRHGWLIAESEGFAPTYIEDLLSGPGRDGAEIRIDVTLVRGLTVSGTVVDGDTRRPIADATVVCWSDEGMMSFGNGSGAYRKNPVGRRSLGRTTSDADGAFRFEHLPAKGPNRMASHRIGRRGFSFGFVAVWKDGYVYGGDEIPVAEDGTTFETTVELWPAATVEGRVVDSEGDPVADATVIVTVQERHPPLNGFPRLWDGQPPDWPHTDAEGRFRTSSLRASRNAPTTALVHAMQRVARSWMRTQPVVVTAMPGETVRMDDIVLDASTLLRATLVVVDGRGLPVPGAVIGIGPEFATTDKDGRVEWAAQVDQRRNAPGATQTVIVRAEGYGQQNVSFVPGVGTPVIVDVTLRSGAKVSGRVIPADGRPVKGVTVHVFDGGVDIASLLPANEIFFTPRDTTQRLAHFAQVTVGSDGRFAVGDLPGGPYHVVAEKASRAPRGMGGLPAPVRVVASGVPPGTDDLVLTLPEDPAPLTQPLEIVVSDAEGGAVEDAMAYAVLDGPLVFARPAGPGRLLFEGLPPGNVRVEVSAKGFCPRSVAGLVIDVGLTPDPVAVTLGRGATLRGTVQAAVGKLPSTARLVLVPASGDGLRRPAPAPIAASGAYEVTGLGPGTYFASVVEGDGIGTGAALVPDGGVAVAIADTVGDGGVVTRDFVVRPGATLSAFVSDARLAGFGGTGTAAQRAFSRNARVEFADGTGMVLRTVSPMYENWHTRFAVAPGDYVVRYVVGGAVVRERRVTLGAGGSESLSLTAE